MIFFFKAILKKHLKTTQKYFLKTKKYFSIFYFLKKRKLFSKSLTRQGLNIEIFPHLQTNSARDYGYLGELQNQLSMEACNWYHQTQLYPHSTTQTLGFLRHKHPSK